MRIILFTGKGGVGKTTLSAATALRSAELGYRTLIMSTDTAHSLSDVLCFQLQNKPTKIKENLSGQEIDVQKEMEENWGMVADYVAAFLQTRGMEQVVAEELAIIPGFEELFSLIEIKEHLEKKKYEVLIVDSAPTASTLRLLSFPDVLNWYVKNVFNITRVTKKVLGKFSKDKPPSDGGIVGMMETLYEKIDGLRDILINKNNTSVRLVVNPEKMVIKEAHRAYTYFSLFGLHTDAVMVNKILPPEASDPFLSKWKEIQKQHLELIKESFAPLPIYKVKMFGEEMVGLDLLRKLAKNVYDSEDPTRILYTEKTIELIKEKNISVLKIKLPFVEKDKVDLLQRDDELIVRIGSFKHSIALPSSLVGQTPTGAKIIDGILNVYFGGK